MFFSMMTKLFGLKDTKSKIKELEAKAEEAFQIAMHNQCIILEMTKIITDLANDQVILSEFIKKNSGISESNKSKVLFTYIDDDDDLLN